MLIKRTKSGQAPYWTTPGGGVESTDASLEAALRRELLEELGASADRFAQVFLFTVPAGEGISVQHFFACRLIELREATRSGPEFDDPLRGDYQLDRVTIEKLPAVDLKPEGLTEFITSNKEALLSV